MTGAVAPREVPEKDSQRSHFFTEERIIVIVKLSYAYKPSRREGNDYHISCKRDIFNRKDNFSA